MLLLVTSLKLIVELALMALAGQGVLAVLAGPRRDVNVFYLVLRAMTRPFVQATRRVTPRVVLDRHVPLLTGLLLALLWVAVVIAKVSLCVQAGMVGCR